MNKGEQLVQMLCRIGYPEADCLRGSDLDWMFNSPSVAAFLSWLCDNLGPQNVVSEKELREMEKLLSSGKPLLERSVLEIAVQALSSGPLGVREERDVDDDDAADRELRDLEMEIRRLENVRASHVHRRKMLQDRTRSMSRRLSNLQHQEVIVTQQLNASRKALETENGEINVTLDDLVAHISDISKFYCHDGIQGAGGSIGARPFLSGQDLTSYLAAEERLLSDLAVYVLKAEVKDDEAVETRDRKEWHRQCVQLGTEFALIRWQLAVNRSREKGLKAALAWAEKRPNRQACILNKRPLCDLCARLGTVQKDLDLTKAEVYVLRESTLPLLFQDITPAVCAPVVCEELEGRLSRQAALSNHHDWLIHNLTEQSERFDYLRTAFEGELKHHQQLVQIVKNVGHSLHVLKTLSTQLQTLFSSAAWRDHDKSDLIGPSDSTMTRLYQLLGNAQELVPTYSGLEKLVEETFEENVSLELRLADIRSRTQHRLSEVVGACDSLQKVVYPTPAGFQYGPPLLTPKTVHDAIQDLEEKLQLLAPHVSELFRQIKTQQQRLAASPHLRTRRELYVHFLLQPDLLPRIVGDLEQGKVVQQAGVPFPFKVAGSSGKAWKNV
uniref:HAUS augmin-like complex subunit 3 n=1 Tax=Myxine glutinosa TaxID=7769 RepID=UPI00358FD4DE